MQRTAFELCSRCRPSLWKTEQRSTSRLFHHAPPAPAPAQPQRQIPCKTGYPVRHPFPTKGVPNFRPSRQLPSADSQTIILQRLKDYVTQWKNERTIRRLESFGIPRRECEELLSLFRASVRKLSLPSIETYDEAKLSHLSNALTQMEQRLTIERAITQIFIDWVLLPQFRVLYETSVAQITFDRLRDIRSVTDFAYPAERFPDARAMKRKIIMHVGPTNSGKTHHALRALAAAKTGVYAGPLRLLAHEIWDRLNKGQIIPLGVDPDKDAEADDDGGTDILDGHSKSGLVITKQTYARYARPCNLSTGEEQRVVSDEALLSCTVEMLPFAKVFDVAIIDEIQMISDSSRGSGWTAAVLGLCARELHLCGEDTAIPLIEELVRETGDELVINRYRRLTPLRVADKSLEGDYSKIQKGDCVVTFSRTGIYAIKTKIERLTGLRCAVAYGRLPPEIRSEQAALFNDPSSGYDVMVGSDAIGMGLNLKIKRVVFDAVRKWDGRKDQALSTSQIKQIAGRAGRYGLHSDSNTGGLATTLNSEDLPILRKAMAAPISPLTFAGLPRDPDAFRNLYHALPPDSTDLVTLADNFDHLSRVRAPYRLTEDTNIAFALSALNHYSKRLTLSDLLLWYSAPVQWRDEQAATVARHFLRSHCEKFTVSLTQSLDATGLSQALKETLQSMNGLRDPASKYSSRLRDPRTKMITLETLHRSIVLYLWMSLRNPVIFPEHAEAERLKEQAEGAMDFVLRTLTKKKEGARSSSRTRLKQTKTDRGRWGFLCW